MPKRPRHPDPEPLEVDEPRIVLAGIGLWVVALVLLATVFRDDLRRHHATWWLWAARSTRTLRTLRVRRGRSVPPARRRRRTSARRPRCDRRPTSPGRGPAPARRTPRVRPRPRCRRTSRPGVRRRPWWAAGRRR